MGEKYDQWKASLSPAEPGGLTVEQYRRHFATGTGSKIFADMLIDLCVFAHLETTEDMAKHNAGIRLLINTGVLKPNAEGKLNGVDVQKIVTKLLSIKED